MQIADCKNQREIVFSCSERIVGNPATQVNIRKMSGDAVRICYAKYIAERQAEFSRLRYKKTVRGRPQKVDLERSFLSGGEESVTAAGVRISGKRMQHKRVRSPGV